LVRKARPDLLARLARKDPRAPLAPREFKGHLA